MGFHPANGWCFGDSSEGSSTGSTLDINSASPAGDGPPLSLPGGKGDAMTATASLRLLGTPTLHGPSGPVSGRAVQRHRLALLALLAATRGHTLSREKLIGLLWPETDAPRARHLLSVALHEIRSVLGEVTVFAVGNDLHLDSDHLDVDVAAMMAAVAVGDSERVVALYSGPFLDGLFLPDAEEFERWVEGIRSELRRSFLEALEEVGIRAMQGGDPKLAVRHFSKLAHEDPLNSRYVAALLQAWEAAGDHGNAIAFGVEHAKLLQLELGTEPDSGFQSLMARLRSEPTTVDRQLSASSLPNAEGVEAGDSITPLDGLVTVPTRWRPRLVAGVLIAGVATAGAVMMVTRPGPTLPPTTVAVAPFEDQSGDSALTYLGELASGRIQTAASRLGLAHLVLLRPAPASAGLSPGEPSSPTARAKYWLGAARNAGAGTLVVGSYWLEADSIHLAATLVDVETSRSVAAAGRAVALVTGASSALADLEERVLGALAARLDPRLAGVSSRESPAPRFAAYLEFAAGADAWVHGEGNIAANHFLRAGQIDSTFFAARVWAAEALLTAARFEAADSATSTLLVLGGTLPRLDRHGVGWLQATLRGDRFGALREARAAANLAPTSRWVGTYGNEANSLGRSAEVLPLLLRLAHSPGWLADGVQFHRIVGSSLHAVGRFNEELDVVRKARRLETDLVIYAVAESRALAGLGRVEELNRLVDETLAIADQPHLNPGSLMQRAATELEAHGHDDAARGLLERAARYYEGDGEQGTVSRVDRWPLASVYSRLGRLEEARALYQELHVEMPGAYAAHAGLGSMAARQGDREEALRWEARLAVAEPTWNVFDAAMRTYHRAEIWALLGEPDRAMELLRRSVSEGLPNDKALDSTHLSRSLWSLRTHLGLGTLVREGR